MEVGVAAMNDTWGPPTTTVVPAPRRDALSIIVPMTVVYALIFLLGVVGNISTCVVIARNKHMHTATNYYLFSLAVSDLLLLISGLPPEMYFIWFKTYYADSDTLCVLQGFAAETSANATVLTITAFTVERYVAICHPFQSHVVSKLSRAIKFIVAIWVAASFLAVPQASQFRAWPLREHSGVVCNMKHTLLQHAFSISTCVFFLVPMTVITVLYVLIGVRLRRTRVVAVVAVGKTPSVSSDQRSGSDRSSKAAARSQNYVIRMLVAVVVAFFICWAPFHVQRMFAVYANEMKVKNKTLDVVYMVLTYVSGILYFMSATVNPVLYNIMSRKFREAFKSTLAQCCGREKYSPRKRAYSVLSRCNNNHHHQQLYRTHPEWQHAKPPPAPPPAAGNPEEGTGLLAAGKQTKCPPTAAAASDNLNHSYPQYQPRPRMSSNSSQLTLTTSVGRLSLVEGNGGGASQGKRTGCSLLRSHPSISALARMLRGGGGGEGRQEAAATVTNATAAPVLVSHHSVDSGRSTTNTISNSSLQDLDEAEFVGADLASYMGELNELAVLH